MTDLDRIKQELTIRDELDRRGIRPVRSDAHKAFYKCPLPGHDDKNASFVCYRDTNSFYCFGCDESGSIIDLVMKLDNVSFEHAVRYLGGNVRAISSRKERAAQKTIQKSAEASLPVNTGTALHPGAGLTLEQLCEAKHLQVSFLESLGCCNTKRNGVTHVTVPYLSETGETLAVRSRLALTGNRFRWRKNDKLQLYGLDRLTMVRERGWVLLVEGESDCWTAWTHDIPALGVPGKGAWRSEWAAKVSGLDCYVWQEPEAEDFTRRLAADIPNLRVIVHPEGTKDLSDAHIAGQDVVKLVETLKAEAPRAADLLRDRLDDELAEIKEVAWLIIEADDPLQLVRDAIRAQGCVFRPKPISDSTSCRSPNPRHADQPVRSMAIGHSRPCRSTFGRSVESVIVMMWIVIRA